MYKMVIADDEVLILRGLRKIVDWKELGIEIIGEATNGSDAEKLIIDKEPDLAILDICMPKKTGLQILKSLSEKKVKTKVLFLSGFEEFAYVQEAIKYGALYYLLKPVNIKELVAAINSALAQVCEEEKAESAIMKLSKIEKDNDYVNLASVKNEYNYYTALSIVIKDIDSHDSEMTRLYMFSIFNAIDNYISSKKLGMAFTKDNTIFVILNHEKNDNFPVQTANSIVAEIRNTCNHEIIIGIGLTNEGISKTKKSIIAAKYALNYRFIDEKSNVFVYAKSLIDEKEEEVGYEDNIIDQVLELIAKHYSENITLEFVAKEVHMNSYYLSTYFKKHTGMNFKDYLTKLRMSEAVKLLNESDLKTYELAEKVGFTDARYFSTLFKKYYGKTPREHKNKSKKLKGPCYEN